MTDGQELLTQSRFEPEDGFLAHEEISALIEALLLVADEPVVVEELAYAAGVTIEELEHALTAMESSSERGWVIQRHGGKVELATAPRFSAQVRRFLNLDREARLSPAALETLAIVAYTQPVTRSEIEAVRGVDCVAVLATLHNRHLIESVGRVSTAGNPIQYGTTIEFLRHFGLHSLVALPPLGLIDGTEAKFTLDAMVATAQTVVTPSDS